MYEQVETIELKEDEIALVIGEESALYMPKHRDDSAPVNNATLFMTAVFLRMKNDHAFVQDQIDYMEGQLREMKKRNGG